MSNLDVNPEAKICTAGDAVAEGAARQAEPAHADAPVAVEIITARDVPLGGPRAMTVRRTLPQRKRSMIGAWCFVDHYGPDDVSVSGGMDVAPHPHTGLQTVSWLFEGEIQHIDSGGGRGVVKPGELNVMTSGDGICHSETSTENVTQLHGVQLWVALPDAVRKTASRNFVHYAPERLKFAGGSALVFLGSVLGETSPVETFSPMLGAELVLDPGATVELEVDPAFEHGLLVDAGDVELEGVSLPEAGVGYTGIGAATLEVKNVGDTSARLVLLGGEPFEEDIVMWWNFLGRSGEEIEQMRADWESRANQSDEERDASRFGRVADYVGHGGPNKDPDGRAWLHAPTLPNGAIRARVNPAPTARPDMPEPGAAPETRRFLRGQDSTDV